MRILFLSHCPHEVHLEFAKSVGARIKVLNLNWIVKLIKKFSLLGNLYPLISILYSFFIKFNEEILLVEGGSSLYLASFLKKINPNLKIIYLDVDMYFYYYSLPFKLYTKKLQKFFFKEIDAIISISDTNSLLIPGDLNVLKKVAFPYPKEIKKINIARKNYSLYVGRLDPDKNILRIIEFALQCPLFEKFIIIGDGTYKNKIKEISRQNKKIIYLGQRDDVSKFYSKCKFLIHLPDYDPHPCTTMEAALCGCFPIIPKNIGTNYLFDKIFIVNNANDFNEINQKIKNILDNEKKAKKLLGKSVKKFPTKENSIKSFKNIFDNLIKEVEKNAK